MDRGGRETGDGPQAQCEGGVEVQEHGSAGRQAVPLAVLFTAATLAACTPTVKVEAPDKPIEINLNVKIEQEVRIKIDREIDELIASNPDLF